MEVAVKIRHAVNGLLAAALFAGVAVNASAQADNTNSTIAPAEDFVGTSPNNWRTHPLVIGHPIDTYYWNGHTWVLADPGPQFYVEERRVYTYSPADAPPVVVPAPGYQGPGTIRPY